MRRVVACVLWVAACSGTVPVKPAAKPGDEPKLDITAPWLDPEAFWIRGVPPQQRPLSDALSDPSAPTIVIRAATIMTAAGKIIQNGSIVLEHGSITSVTEGDVQSPPGAVIIDGKG